MRRPDPAYAVLVLLAVAWVGAATTVHPPAPPDESPERAAAGAVDLERLEAHVARLAEEPRPPGSPAHERAREHLVAEFEALGLDPAVQSARVPADPDVEELPWLEPAEGEPDVERDEDGRPLVPIANVLARLPGTRGAGAVLLQAHYDSRPDTPGAADDATGVAAVLETARLVLADGPPANDLIVHLDDGEELGLLGAELFAEEHPWMADVRCVVNLDARGNAGSPIVFELGRGSAPLVRALAASEARPVMPSLAAAVYRRMPNDTSFSPFRDRGLPGVNVAFVGGASAYHAEFDTPENLSRRTLHRAAEYALAATRAALDADLDALGPDAGGEATSFRLGPAGHVVHPRWWSYPLALVPLGLLALALRRGRRLGASPRRGLAPALGLAALTFAVAWLGWWIARAVGASAVALGFFGGEPRGNLASATLGGFGAFGLGVAQALAWTGRRRDDARGADRAGDTALAGAVAWSALLVLLLLAVPEAAYVATWPLALALPATIAGLGRARPGALATAYGVAAHAAAALILAPTFYLLVQVASVRPARVPLLAGAFAAAYALLFLEPLRAAAPRVGAGPAKLAAGASAAALAAGALAAASGL